MRTLLIPGFKDQWGSVYLRAVSSSQRLGAARCGSARLYSAGQETLPLIASLLPLRSGGPLQRMRHAPRRAQLVTRSWHSSRKQSPSCRRSGRILFDGKNSHFTAKKIGVLQIFGHFGIRLDLDYFYFLLPLGFCRRCSNLQSSPLAWCLAFHGK